MKRAQKYAFFLLAACLFTIQFPLHVAAKETIAVDSVSGATPNGTQVIEITSADDLTAMSQNFGSTEYPKNAIYTLTADIDMAGKSFKMMGTSSNVNTKFSGIFAGNGHTISNLTITSASEAGFFATLNSNAIVEDLIFLNPVVKATGSSSNGIGVIAAHSSGQIKNCTVMGGTISGGSWVGGLVGNQDGSSISGCAVDANTTISSSSGGDGIGGIVGAISGGTIKTSFSRASVGGGSQIGGIAGTTTDTNLQNCYSGGTVTSSYRSAGGLIGHVVYGGGSVTKCYSTAEVINNGSSMGYVGGLIGRITNGMNEVSDSVAINKALTGTKNMGYIAGGGTYLPALSDNLAWDEITLSGTAQNTDVNSSRPTQNDLLSKSTFEEMGWDFENVWIWSSSKDGSYPKLRGLEGQSYHYPFKYTFVEIPHTVTASPDSTSGSWVKELSVKLAFESETAITQKQYCITASAAAPAADSNLWISIADSDNEVTPDFETLDSGTYYIHWQAIKQFDPISSDNTPFGTYLLDKTIPNLAFLSKSVSITDGSFSLAVTASDEHSGIIKYAFLVDSETLTDDHWQNSSSMTFSGLNPEQAHTFTVYAMDAAKNVSKPVTHSIAAVPKTPQVKGETDTNDTDSEITSAKKSIKKQTGVNTGDLSPDAGLLLSLLFTAGVIITIILVRKKAKQIF